MDAATYFGLGCRLNERISFGVLDLGFGVIGSRDQDLNAALLQVGHESLV